MQYGDLEEKRVIVKEFIKQNQNTTHREIKEALGIKVDRLYSGGMSEAFDSAGVAYPRTLKFRSLEENRRIIINFIRKNPNTNGKEIKEKTKINYLRVFESIQDAFKKSKIDYPIDRINKNNKLKESIRRKKVLEHLRKNPLITMEELIKATNVQIYHIFSGAEEIYNAAGISYVDKASKWREKKKIQIVKYIKKNGFPTQRELNLNCRTHVQRIFDGGIFEAYKLAGKKFPSERLKFYGVGLKKVRRRSKDFERKVALELGKFGSIKRNVKTPRGFADIVFEKEGQKLVVEVKDYLKKEISKSQINQLKRYVEDLDCDLGLLVCHNPPKKDSFLIPSGKIFVVEYSKLRSKILNILGT